MVNRLKRKPTILVLAGMLLCMLAFFGIYFKYMKSERDMVHQAIMLYLSNDSDFRGHPIGDQDSLEDLSSCDVMSVSFFAQQVFGYPIIFEVSCKNYDYDIFITAYTRDSFWIRSNVYRRNHK